VGAEGVDSLMGWKYETEVYMFENTKNEGWVTHYRGNSLLKAIQSVRWMRRTEPGRAYRLVIR
jgi:hypothetical protein